MTSLRRFVALIESLQPTPRAEPLPDLRLEDEPGAEAEPRPNDTVSAGATLRN